MTHEMTEEEQAELDKIREAMKDPYVSLHLVPTFTHGRGVQVKIKNRKVGRLIFPPVGDTLADVLRMLGAMAEEGEKSSG